MDDSPQKSAEASVDPNAPASSYIVADNSNSSAHLALPDHPYIHHAFDVPTKGAEPVVGTYTDRVHHNLPGDFALTQDFTSPPAVRIHLPMGIYILAGLFAASSVYAFFSGALTNVWTILSVILQLCIIAGLLLGKNRVRQFVVILTFLGAISVVATLALTIALYVKVEGKYTTERNDITMLINNASSATEKSGLVTIQNEIDRQNKNYIIQFIRYDIIRDAVELLVYVAPLAYLTRPKVKEVYISRNNEIY